MSKKDIIIKYSPYEEGGVQYGQYIILREIPKMPWYKRWWVGLEIWWYS